ncbi:hypothetical protein V8G54_006210 [Vigna mungo]|uniref:Uncharacterized protein n=1 Tax=Vigna mungo TaxID=3915 RepID=A0AAQ3S732_VIGMU
MPNIPVTATYPHALLNAPPSLKSTSDNKNQPPRATQGFVSRATSAFESRLTGSPLAHLGLALGGGATITAARRWGRVYPPFPVKNPSKRQHATHRRPKRRRILVTQILVPRRHLNGHTNQRRFPRTNRRGRTRGRTGYVLLRTGLRFANSYNNLRFGRALDRCATKRTRGVGVKPHVDAVCVEAVVTLR